MDKNLNDACFTIRDGPRFENSGIKTEKKKNFANANEN